MSRSTSTALIVLCLFLTFPFWIGIVGGLFGIIMGIGGAIIGIIAGIIGAIVGLIGGIFGFFSWGDYDYSFHFPFFPSFKTLLFIAVIAAIVIISKSKKK